MSLRDEFPSQNHSVVTPIKYAEQEEISRQICEFVAFGGRITSVPAGASGDKQEERNREKGSIGGKVNAKKYPKKEKVKAEKNQSPWGENIGKYSDDCFYVVICKKYYGKGMRWNNDQARDFRDKKRSELGLRPALY